MLIKNKLSYYKQSFNLIFYFSISNIKLRFKNTYFGMLWSALEPLLYFIVLYIVFINIRDRESDFAIYLLTGIMIFHIFSRGTSGGLASITSNGGIIKSIRIKREFFPIVSTTTAAILSIFSVGVFFGLMPIFQFIPTSTVFLLPIVFVLLLVLILGASFLLSVLVVFVKDIKIIWPIFVHSLLFLSPIFWQVENAKGILLDILKVNPIGQLIELGHKLVIDGVIPPLNDWLYTSAWVFGILFVGYLIFNRLQERIVEEL
jgi:ABC-type polysaccharide/polyol phosphate export permease